MNLDEKLREMAAEEVISLPQSYGERLKKVYASLEEHPGKTRRGPRISRLLLAAALAVCCILLAAAATDRLLPLLSGGRLVVRPDGSWSATDGGGEIQDPVILEEGCLWFVANGERLDLTDLVDGETPYLYTFQEENSTLTHYVAVGGTPEDFGWTEWLQEEGEALRPTISQNTWEVFWLHEGELYDPENLTPELQAIWEAEGETHTGQLVYKDWYLAALDQLGLERPEAPLSSVWRGHPAP